MVWSCKACTFENENDKDRDQDQEQRCSMCGGKRQLSSAKPNASKQQQQTLLSFGNKPVMTESKRSSTKLNHLNHSFSRHVRKTSPSKQEILNTLKSVFGLEKLRPLQEQVVTTALLQNDNHNEYNNKNHSSQLVVMATGGGKSLCYQLPACLLGGVTIVISPLIALMQDQVAALKKRNIPAACLSSANTDKQNTAILDLLLLKLRDKQQSFVLLYITPESIQTSRMQRVLHQLHDQKRLAMFAVDEAHCLSSWGHDFRPAYRKLSWLRTHFASVPCMACTATATPKVMQDIQSCLQLPVVYQGRLDRHNIYYKVKYNKNYPSSIQTTTSALQDLSMTIQKLYQQHKESKTGCCGIVYAHKRTDTTMLATAIAKALGGTEKAAAYHGGLPKKERLRVLEGFACQTIPIVVATVAFGMGIDVSNVRVVIHWNMPKSLEAFAQESGRAGRDGLPCHSILYYCPEDYGKFQFLLRKQYQQDEQRGDKQKKRPDPKLLQSKLKALEQMRDYCITAKCRRNALISHFGGDAVDCGKTCDFCANPQRVSRTIQSSLVAPSKASTTRTSFASATKWDGQWSGPHGSNDDVDGFDDEDMIAKDWGGGFVGDLKVTGSSSKKSGGFGGMGGFKTASSLLKNPAGKNSILSVLNKYENMEDNKQETISNGFIRFGSNKSTTPIIPEHFKASLPDPSTVTIKKAPPPAQPKKSSMELQNDLDRINGERQERLQALLAKQKKRKEESTASASTLTSANAPPPLTFGTAKRRRKN